MRFAVRSVGVALLALLAAVLLALTSTVTNVFTLTATVYILKGTNSAFNQIPDSAYPPFASSYIDGFKVPVPPSPPPVSYVIVPYPATFRPITPPGYIFSPTFDQSVAQGVKSLQKEPVATGDVLWGYSQGATVVTLYKRNLNSTWTAGDPVPTYVLVANPNRPNGGILERGVALGTIPLLGLTFSGATPTTTTGADKGQVTTYDIARQYDGVADAPTNPLNVVSDANAVMGFALLHSQYPNADLSTAIKQGQYGDTQYYLIPTTTLPLLMPVAMVPVVGPVAATALDPALRVIVEAGYDRTISPGQPTPFNLLYFPNPVDFGTNLAEAVPIGVDNGLAAAGVGRALGTTPVTNPYGVGGPDPNTGIQATTAATVSPAAGQQPVVNSPQPGTAADQNVVTPSNSTALSASTPSAGSQQAQVTNPPVNKPQLGLIRGPIINASPSLAGVNSVASSVNGAVKQTTAAVTGSLNSVTSAVKNAVSGITGKSTTTGAQSSSTGGPSS